MKWHVLALTTIALIGGCDQATPNEPSSGVQPSFAADMQHQTITQRLAFPADNPCNAEPGSFEGSQTTQVTEGTDAGGGYHVYTSTQTEATGTGVFGNHYAFNQDFHDEFYADQPFPVVVTQEHTVNVIGSGTVPDFKAHFLMHYTVDNNGVVTAEMLYDHAECS